MPHPHLPGFWSFASKSQWKSGAAGRPCGRSITRLGGELSMLRWQPHASSPQHSPKASRDPANNTGLSGLRSAFFPILCETFQRFVSLCSLRWNSQLRPLSFLVFCPALLILILTPARNEPAKISVLSREALVNVAIVGSRRKESARLSCLPSLTVTTVEKTGRV